VPRIPPPAGLQDPTWHGEVGAIRNAAKNLGNPHLKGCVLYTSSEPCPMCMGACYWARIDRVFYATTTTDVKHYGRFEDEDFYLEVSEQPPRCVVAPPPLPRGAPGQAPASVADCAPPPSPRAPSRPLTQPPPHPTPPLQLSKAPADRQIPCSEFMRTEAIEVWKEFHELPDKCHY